MSDARKMDAKQPSDRAALRHLKETSMTRRKFSLMAVGALGSLVLGGCAANDIAPASSADSQAADSSASAPAATSSSADENSSSAPSAERASVHDGKVLVAYFTNTGNTKGIAEKIADSVGATLFAIEPVDPYTSSDLDYNNDDARCMKELSDPSSRPEIANTVGSWQDYDIVFLGYPLWWSRTPPIMQTFVESYDWTGKTAIPFCTSGSSDIGTSANVLENEAPGSTWLDGRRFSASASDAEVAPWAKGKMEEAKR